MGGEWSCYHLDLECPTQAHMLKAWPLTSTGGGSIFKRSSSHGGHTLGADIKPQPLFPPSIHSQLL